MSNSSETCITFSESLASFAYLASHFRSHVCWYGQAIYEECNTEYTSIFLESSKEPSRYGTSSVSCHPIREGVFWVDNRANVTFVVYNHINQNIISSYIRLTAFNRQNRKNICKTLGNCIPFFRPHSKPPRADPFSAVQAIQPGITSSCLLSRDIPCRPFFYHLPFS